MFFYLDSGNAGNVRHEHKQRGDIQRAHPIARTCTALGNQPWQRSNNPSFLQFALYQGDLRSSSLHRGFGRLKCRTCRGKPIIRFIDFLASHAIVSSQSLKTRYLAPCGACLDLRLFPVSRGPAQFRLSQCDLAAGSFRIQFGQYLTGHYPLPLFDEYLGNDSITTGGQTYRPSLNVETAFAAG